MTVLSLVACRVLRGTGDDGAVSGSMPGTAWHWL